MSVATFDKPELEAMWAALGGTPEIGGELLIASVANRAAAMLSYGETMEPCGIEEPTPFSAANPFGSHMDWVENLAYNCVSQGGVNFLPSGCFESLMDAAAWADCKGRTKQEIASHHMHARASLGKGEDADRSTVANITRLERMLRVMTAKGVEEVPA
jgi:hypothetical protein